MPVSDSQYVLGRLQIGFRNGWARRHGVSAARSGGYIGKVPTSRSKAPTHSGAWQSVSVAANNTWYQYCSCTRPYASPLPQVRCCWTCWRCLLLLKLTVHWSSSADLASCRAAGRPWRLMTRGRLLQTPLRATAKERSTCFRNGPLSREAKRKVLAAQCRPTQCSRWHSCSMRYTSPRGKALAWPSIFDRTNSPLMNPTCVYCARKNEVLAVLTPGKHHQAVASGLSRRGRCQALTLWLASSGIVHTDQARPDG